MDWWRKRPSLVSTTLFFERWWFDHGFPTLCSTRRLNVFPTILPYPIPPIYITVLLAVTPAEKLSFKSMSSPPPPHRRQDKPTATTNNTTVRLNKFVRRLHEMLSCEQGRGVVEWRRGVLVLHSINTIFAKETLPKYFGTRNFKTFRRQLNYYGEIWFVELFCSDNTWRNSYSVYCSQFLAMIELRFPTCSIFLRFWFGIYGTMGQPRTSRWRF